MVSENTALLSTAYFPPIQYFSKVFKYDRVIIEQHENYTKQTYRNRCHILGANGVLGLTIPILKFSGVKIKIKDVRIDYDKPWQRLHYKSIESAYRHSPFYEFYIDDIKHFFEKKFSFLVDLNLQIHEVLCELLQIKSSCKLSEYFYPPNDRAGNDFRYMIHPKSQFEKPDVFFTHVEYYQVFKDRHGFRPNLSALDLIFNEGPNAIVILEKSTQALKNKK
jgi:hypothetical protein